MIETLISSKTRIKLLLKFFLNSNTRSYLRSLEQEFGDSSNGIRIELNRLEEAGMLISTTEGNRRYFQANQQHPLYEQIHQILMKTFGIDRILDEVIHPLGNVQQVYLTGDLARGIDTPVIDLHFIGEIDPAYLKKLVSRTEKRIQRKIRTRVDPPDQFDQSLLESTAFLLYSELQRERSILDHQKPSRLIPS